MSTAPAAGPQNAAIDEAGLEKVRSGQRLIIFAILANFLFIGVRHDYPLLSDVVCLVAAFVAIIGVLRLAAGLGYGLGAKIVCVVLAFIPLVGLITMLVLSSRATRVLRNAGYKVGLLGAPRRAESQQA